MIKEILPKKNFKLKCDDCKTEVEVSGHNEQDALLKTWRKCYEFTEGNHGRGYHRHEMHLCGLCHVKREDEKFLTEIVLSQNRLSAYEKTLHLLSEYGHERGLSIALRYVKSEVKPYRADVLSAVADAEVILTQSDARFLAELMAHGRNDLAEAAVLALESGGSCAQLELESAPLWAKQLLDFLN